MAVFNFIEAFIPYGCFTKWQVCYLPHLMELKSIELFIHGLYQLYSLNNFFDVFRLFMFCNLRHEAWEGSTGGGSNDSPGLILNTHFISVKVIHPVWLFCGSTRFSELRLCWGSTFLSNFRFCVVRRSFTVNVFIRFMWLRWCLSLCFRIVIVGCRAILWGLALLRS